MKPEARHEGLVTREWRGETLVYDLDTHRARRLNPTAAFGWRQCDGRSSVAQIAGRLGRLGALSISCRP